MEAPERAIALDFDGTLCENKYPEIGAPKWDVIRQAKQEKEAGTKLILWTCREGALLQEALAACRRWGLELDAVNDSLASWKRCFGDDPRKIGATEYWDDKAVNVRDIEIRQNRE